MGYCPPREDGNGGGVLLGEGRENWKVLSAAFLHNRDELAGLDPVDINVVVSGDQQQSGQQNVIRQSRQQTWRNHN